MTKRTHDHTRPPRATSSTTATQHGYIVNTTARALLEPSLLFGPCQIGISPEYAPYQKPRPRSGFDNAISIPYETPVTNLSVCGHSSHVDSSDQIHAPRHVTVNEVTGPLPSLVLRAEDIWRKYKPFFIEVFGILNPGFPISSLLGKV